ncbi:amino acid adenylation domain-containing protein [Embleya scabrispora]|uniref:amino acid adenylation domain-containing protein n=1 Tax=Embleya scabrispora TaxID=159449 RepID=UPI0003659E0E|nr:amino acid adenylation domain-containing protein [Embleya scabrispora]MYS80784.1 amino acid adenylation domain-containing protein [Streptomyces sp. SID5474]
MTDLLHQLLRESAARTPHATAVIDDAGVTTYAELDQRANQVAHLLRSRGVRPGDRVGLHLPRTADALVGVYGVLAAGAAYVPLPLGVPASRLRTIVIDAGIRIILAAHDDTTQVRADLGGPDSPLTDVVAPRAAAELSGEPPQIPVEPDDLAYVLYTSGSTGVPKGVMISHRNAMSFVDWAAREFCVTGEDRLANHAPLHFDLSVFDVFAAAWAGAAVVPVPPQAAAFPAVLADFVRTQQITVWYSVPSALNLLVSRSGLRAGDLPALRLVLFAGEVYPLPQLRSALETLPDACFYNLYGPTETNVCTYYRVPRPFPADSAALPIGIPLPGIDLCAETDDGRLAGVGETGELCVRGTTVMRGYLGDPARTAQALRPVVDGPGIPTYHTGDLVTRDSDGHWHFLGRRDSQIKTRGYRVELGEVERALALHPAVVECAVVAVPDEEFGHLIAAFVVLREEVATARLTAHCRTVLPSYMVPWRMRAVTALPRTTTDKIDYRLLKADAEESAHAGHR